MKQVNRGITLSETLCYIIIFSLLVSVISSYTIYINKYYIKKEKTIIEEITFLEKLCNNIDDYKFINKEELYYYENNNEKLILKGTNTNQIYMEFSYQDQVLYNGLIGKKIKLTKFNIQFICKENYILITNITKNYHFIIEVN